jgi:hypothetical protein
VIVKPKVEKSLSNSKGRVCLLVAFVMLSTFLVAFETTPVVAYETYYEYEYHTISDSVYVESTGFPEDGQCYKLQSTVTLQYVYRVRILPRYTVRTLYARYVYRVIHYTTYGIGYFDMQSDCWHTYWMNFEASIYFSLTRSGSLIWDYNGPYDDYYSYNPNVQYQPGDVFTDKAYDPDILVTPQYLTVEFQL